MNFRTTYYLMGAAGAVLLGLFFYVLFSDSKPTGAGFLFENFNASSLKTSDITTVEIERAGETLTFIREGKDKWKMAKPVEARVDSSSVEAIVRDLLSAKREEKGVDIRDKKTHGLEQPKVKVTLKKGADRQTTLALGDVTPGQDKAVVFVTSSDSKDSKPWATRKTSLTALFKFPAPEAANDTASLIKGLNDFRSTKLLGADIRDPMAQTSSIRIRQGKNEVVLSRRPDGNWRFDIPAGYGDAESEGAFNPAGAEKVNNVRALLQNAFNIQVAAPADFIDKPEGLEKYGLNPGAPELLEIEVERRPLTGEDPTGKETLYIGKPTGMAGDKVYAMLQGEPAIAQVNATPVKALKGVLDDPKILRTRDLVKLQREKVDAIDIQGPAGTMELRLVGDLPAWKVFDSSGNAQPANRLTVEELIGALNAPKQVIDFPPVGAPDNVLGFDKPTGEIRVWVSGIVKEEPKKEEPKKVEAKKEEAKKEEAKKDDAGKKEDVKKEEAKKEEPKKAASAKPQVAAVPSVRIIFGKETGEGVYVRRIDDGGKADLIVPKNLLNQTRKTRLDFLDVSLTPFLPDQVVKVQFTKGKDVYEFEKDVKDALPSSAIWKINSPEARKGRLADAAKVLSLLNQLSFLRPARVTAETPSADELAKLGLDPKAPRLQITLTLKDDTGGDKTRVFIFGNDSGPEKQNVFAKVAGQSVVFETNRPAVDSVEKGDFLDTMVYRIDRAKLKGLKLRGWSDVVGSPVARELEFKNGEWAFKSQVGYELDKGKVDTFLDDVLSPRAESFAVVKGTPGPEHGFDVNKGALEIEFEIEGGKPVTLTLGAADPTGKLTFAQTNQLPGDVFTLLKDRFKSLREKPAVFKKD